VTFVDTAADLGRPRFPRHVWLAVTSWRRLAGRQVSEDERAASEGVEVAENRRVAGQASAEQLLNIRATRCIMNINNIVQCAAIVSLAVVVNCEEQT